MIRWNPTLRLTIHDRGLRECSQELSDPRIITFISDETGDDRSPTCDHAAYEADRRLADQQSGQSAGDNIKEVACASVGVGASGCTTIPPSQTEASPRTEPSETASSSEK